MSEMEYHSGKARKFDRFVEESDLEYAKRYAEYKGLPFDETQAKEYLEESFYTMFGEMNLGGSWRKQMALVGNGIIWELVEHVYNDEPPECGEFSLNPDGTYSFQYYFYNGGTCLSEMFEESVTKIFKKGEQ